MDRRKTRSLPITSDTALVIRPVRRQKAWVITHTDGQWIGKFRSAAEAIAAAQAYVDGCQTPCTPRQSAHT